MGLWACDAADVAALAGNVTLAVMSVFPSQSRRGRFIENLVTSVACSEVGSLELQNLGSSLIGSWHTALLQWDSVSPSVRWVSGTWVFWQQLRRHL